MVFRLSRQSQTCDTREHYRPPTGEPAKPVLQKRNRIDVTSPIFQKNSVHNEYSYFDREISEIQPVKFP